VGGFTVTATRGLKRRNDPEPAHWGQKGEGFSVSQEGQGGRAKKRGKDPGSELKEREERERQKRPRRIKTHRGGRKVMVDPYEK